MGPQGLFSVGDRVIATTRVTMAVTSGSRGTVIEVFPGVGRQTLVQWDVPPGGEKHVCACSDAEIDHLGLLDTLSEL